MEAGNLLSDISLERARSTPIFPVLHSTLSASDLLKEVGREYGIGTPTYCRLFRAKLNDTYLVRTVDERYIFRVYRARWRSLPEISYELELLLHLRKKGIAVSTPLPRRDGGLVGALRAPEGIRYTVLFTYTPGASLFHLDHGWQSAEHVRHSGRTLALFHKAGDDFSSVHTRLPLDFTFLLDEPLQALQPLFAHRPADWQILLSFAEKIRTHITMLGLKNLDWGPCHGGPINTDTPMLNGQGSTFSDFDFCGPGWRAYDLARAYGIARAQHNYAIWENFLRGYREERPLKENDIRAAPFFDVVGDLWSEGLHAANGNEWGFELLDDELFDRTLHNIRDWEVFYKQHYMR